jgi:Trypsin-like peptidase domain
VPPLTTELRDKLQGVLKLAFDQMDLRRFATERLAFNDVKFADEVNFSQGKSKVAFEFVEIADQNARLGELVLAIQQVRPRRPDVAELVAAFGLAPAVQAETAGAAMPGVETTARSGFEKAIKNRLPMFDFAVWREKMTTVEGLICKIEIDGNPAGTGFLVGPAAVLTNYHVLEDVLTGTTPSEKVECVFDCKVLSNGSRMRTTSVGLDPTGWNLDSSPASADEKTRTPDRTVPTTDELDYALVKLAHAVGDEPALSRVGEQAPKRGWLTIPSASPVFLPKAALLIAQHPDGKPLKLSVDTDSVIGVNANRTRVRYTNNTEPGSSGSPVFDLDWNLVALHHLGDPAYDHPPSYNQGVVIDLIRKRIESRGGDALGR